MGEGSAPSLHTNTEPRFSARHRLLLDLATAYAVPVARIASWATIAAVAYRTQLPRYFAALAATRSTTALLNYLPAALGPAVIHALAPTKRRAIKAEAVSTPVTPDAAAPVLGYRAGATLIDDPRTPVRAAAGTVAVFAALLVLVFGAIVRTHPNLFFRTNLGGGSTLAVAEAYGALFAWFATASAIRTIAEPSGATLQSADLIFLDNLLQLVAELITGVLGVVVLLKGASDGGNQVVPVAGAAAAGASFLLVARAVAVRIVALENDSIWQHKVRWRLVASIAKFTALLFLAYLADYLYAPTDYLLINHLLPARAAVAYTPAVQIDSGLLLLTAAIGAVLLPRAAAAYADGDHTHLRRIFIQGTLGASLILAAPVLVAFLAAQPILELWYGQDLPATRAVLPLVLLCTFVGGSSAVGRSVLLAIGRTRAFTAAALIAGAANVILSWTFVYYFHLGLTGIVLGTVVAVIARCGIWMPWFTLRALNHLPPRRAAP